MSDDDVNQQATAALKGMLGIAAGESSSTPTKMSPPTYEQPKTQSNKKSGKKKKKKKNTKQEPQAAPQSKENFAFSAFQSSPDASALPIPIFESPAVPARAIVDVDSRADKDLKTMLGVRTTDETQQAENQPSGVDLSQLASAPPPFK